MAKFKDMTGLSETNNQGCKMTILKYKNSKDIDIIFSDGTIIKHKSYTSFLKKSVFNPNNRDVYGIGYFGIGEYNAYDYSNNKKINHKEIYEVWRNMFERCYANRENYKNWDSYKDVFVDKSFHCFQDFSSWYNDNKWINNIKLCLDKDILKKGNKIYSKDTCILVPQDINKLFIKNNKARNGLPIGVSLSKDGKYRARYKKNNKEISLGTYANEIDAFLAYKKEKENHIKQVADDYANKYPNFPKRLYDAMYNYEVEITD